MPTLSSLAPAAAEPNAGKLVIGLVNNMPDAALRTTERQFGELLAAGNRPIELRYYALPDVPRSDEALAYMHERYEHIDALRDRPVDGLIVTGTEPRNRVLSNEPYWASLAALIDWAEDNTLSTVWSCLAAHAAVLHLDGIERQPFDEKLSGVFDCARTTQHAMTAGVPTLWRVPHSRYNGLPQEALVARDYRILSQSRDAGVDMFLRQKNSLFIFFQGHPEYDPGALLREYRTDVGRFLSGARVTYPNMPRNYFDADLTAELETFRRHAEADRTIDTLARFPIDKTDARFAHALTTSWRSPAQRIYANWLAYLAERKAPGDARRHAAVAAGRTHS